MSIAILTYFYLEVENKDWKTIIWPIIGGFIAIFLYGTRERAPTHWQKIILNIYYILYLFIDDFYINMYFKYPL